MKSFNLIVLACAVVVRAEKESGHVEKFKSYQPTFSGAYVKPKIVEREHGFFKNNRKNDNIHVFSDRLGETFVECNNVNSLQIRLNQEVFIIINVAK